MPKVSDPKLILKPTDPLQSLKKLAREGKPIPRKLQDQPALAEKLSRRNQKNPRRAIEDTLTDALKFHSDLKETARHHHAQTKSFILPYTHLAEPELNDFHQRVALALDGKEGLQVEMSEQQLAQLKAHILNQGNQLGLTLEQLAELEPRKMFIHGNQALSGTPFMHGGLEHIDFFQWGNLMGIIKYAALPEERAIIANPLVYFEQMNEIKLNTMRREYQKNPALFINKIFPQYQNIPKPANVPQLTPPLPQLVNTAPVLRPTLTPYPGQKR